MLKYGLMNALIRGGLHQLAGYVSLFETGYVSDAVEKLLDI